MPANALTAQDRQDILDSLAAENSPLSVISVTEDIANRVSTVPRTVTIADNAGVSRLVNADPADGIIVATAEELGLPLVSADGKIPKMTSVSVIC